MIVRKYVGSSLSACVRDIVEGYVAFDDVLHVIAGTCAYGDRWESMLNQYCQFGRSWSGIAEDAKFVANRLRDEGKIYQPRIDNYPAPSIHNGHWICLEWTTDEPINAYTIPR